ncbi:purine catabolism regulator [Naumannella halotolerans]|uniref:Purine catabolism regulator n=2 Tax=Naumannella halotolerans TaxID=993414 RepID=A0A4R7J9H8_9ACTN|nr:purine catabolism regulator [Naumannella halotolerans]
MNWRMPAETAPHRRTWMAFPREGITLGADPDSGYHAWSEVANAVAAYEPVVMVVDPTELARARSLLDPQIELLEAPRIAAAAYARSSWAIAAQRAIALAALREDGLGPTIDELGRQLQTWVGLYDGAAGLVRSSGPLAADVAEEMGTQVRRLLARRTSAGGAARVGERTVLLQTLGAGGIHHGALAIAAERLDSEARGVVTSVAAMAGFALRQNETLARTHASLRAGVIGALLAGDETVAREIAKAVWGDLPTGRVRVAATEQADGLSAHLRLHDGDLFFGAGPDGLLLIIPGERDELLNGIAERFGVAIGVSTPTTLGEFDRAVEEAQLARRRGSGVNRFSPMAVGLLADADARTVARARALLRPLADHDTARGTDLCATVRTWLLHDARIEDTARALGTHRHTVRSRIRQAEQLLGRDLSSFAVRAELWYALLVAG